MYENIFSLTFHLHNGIFRPTFFETFTNKYARVDKYRENIMQKLIGRKLGLFGHICRMHNNRKIKELMF